MREPAVHLEFRKVSDVLCRNLVFKDVKLWQVCQGTEHREGHTLQQEELGRGMVRLKNKADSGDT